jgi:hypothetical protein
VVGDELDFIMFERVLLCSCVYKFKIPLQILRSSKCVSAPPWEAAILRRGVLMFTTTITNFAKPWTYKLILSFQFLTPNGVAVLDSDPHRL